MSWFVTKDVTIVGMAAAVPKKRVDSLSCVDRFDEKTVEKFVNSTGVKSIHESLPGQTASDLGFAAADNLLNSLSVDRSKIGILGFVTLSPDYKKPATACVLQKRLGLSVDCACLDIGHGCGGFVYGNEVLESMMMNTDAELGLLILGETTSKVTGKSDVNSMMFGDAGAAVLYRHKEGIVHHTLLRSDGTRFKSLIVPSGGFRDPAPTETTLTAPDGTIRSKFNIYMEGTEVFLFSITDVPKAMDEYQSRTDMPVDHYDTVAFHQANTYILQRLIRKYKLGKEQVPLCLDRYGNTSSVSIPLALCDYYGNRSGEEKHILACGFGTGLAWGVTSFEIDPNKVLPVIETDACFGEGVIGGVR